MSQEKSLETDVLVIGGGMAGCFAAIKARESGCDVILLDKGYAGKSGATHFAGGDFMVFNPQWGHKLDTWMNQINARCEYINNRQWGEIVLKESHERYQDLEAWGINFYREGNEIFVGRSGATAYVSMYYREYAPLLRKKALASGVKILDKIMLCELLKHDSRVSGAIGFNTLSGELYIFKARATVIAAGGSSLKEGNRPIQYATADGEAMAYRAGVEISGKEFKFGVAGGPRSSAAQSKNKKVAQEFEAIEEWSRFPSFRGNLVGPMVRPAINAEGGPVINAVWEAHCGRAPLFVDLDGYTPQQIAEYKGQFARQGMAELNKLGIDIFQGGKLKFSAGSIETAQPIHGGASGIWPINEECATALPGLYTAGDSCATMLSGAGYAGMGFGLCHASVTGSRAGLAAAAYASKIKEVDTGAGDLAMKKKNVLEPIERAGGFSPAWVTRVIQNIMIPYFILHVKRGDRLQAALTLVEFINGHLVPRLKAWDPHEWRMAHETRNMALHAEMVLRASLFRTESRGSHFREDYPRHDDPHWLAWVKLSQKEGRMEISRVPVPKEWWPDLSRPYEELYPLTFTGK